MSGVQGGCAAEEMQAGPNDARCDEDEVGVVRVLLEAGTFTG